MRAVSAVAFALAIVSSLDCACARSYNPDDEPDVDEEPVLGKFHKNEEVKKKLETTLKDHLLFRALEPEQLTTIIDAMREVHVKAGEVLIKQGDEGDYFYVIDSGTFEVFIKNGDGKDILVRMFNNGGSFGELALMYNQPRSATVKAKTNGVLLSLDREAFQNIVIKSAHDRRKLHEELLSKVSLFQDPQIYANTFVKGDRKSYLSSRSG